MQDISSLEKLENDAARIVTGKPVLFHKLTYIESVVGIHYILGRKEQKLAFMYKTVNDLTPEYISNLIPHFVRDVTNYSLRNNNNLRVPFTRTEISCKACIPSAISLWNSLDEEIRTSGSLSCFKNKIKNLRTDCNNVPQFFFMWGKVLVSSAG